MGGEEETYGAWHKNAANPRKQRYTEFIKHQNTLSTNGFSEGKIQPHTTSLFSENILFVRTSIASHLTGNEVFFPMQ